jgi:DNA primase catalytic core
MARIDQAEIDRIKRECSVLEIAQRYGTKFKDRGNDEFIGLCPIHDDHDPSLCINKRKNEWVCHGACKTGGDVIQWVMHAEKVNFPQAVAMLQEGVTGQIRSYGNKSLKLPTPFSMEQSDQELLKAVVTFYNARLKECPNGLAYLQKRGLIHPELIDKFKIGFVDRTLGYRLPPMAIKAGEEMRERLKALGILRKTGHEHLRGCVVFPIYDSLGNICQIYGRRIDDGGKAGNPHFYLERPWAGIFNGEALKAFEEIILCESIIDALSFWVAGYRNVIASFGKNGFTDEMLDGVQNSDVKRILIAYDNDEPSNAMIEPLAKKLNGVNIDVFRVKVPAATKDINAYACSLQMGLDKGQPGHAALGLIIRNADWLSNGDKSEPTITTVTPNFLQDARDSIECEEQAKTQAEAAKATAAKKEKAIEAATTTNNKPSLLAANEAAKPAMNEPQCASTGLAVPVVAKQPVAASPQPAVAKATVDAEIKDNEIVIPIGNRTYRVRGLEKNLAFDVLKVNVLVRKNEQFYIDTFDIYAARQRSIFVKEAARELMLDEETIKRDLGKVLLKLEELQDKTIADAQAVKQEKIEITDSDKAAALELLKSENLLDRILDDFEGCGVVGERTNKLVGYLAATSRKLERPLAIMVQSSSAAGKSSLMEAILRFMPNEEQVAYSAMTGQSLFYMGGMNLKNKILAISEEEGIRQASYALKLLQSEGQLTIASTGKDPGTGRMETQEYHVEGPVMIFLTTTAIDVDEELLNRCLVLTVDEDREQTRAILRRQRESRKAAGLRASAMKSSIVKLHQNAQRLLRPLAVVNDYADQLSFLDDQTRRRRDHMKYLTLIEAVALLHQYQRPIHTMTVDDETIHYIEVIPRDIAIANTLAEAVLGRSIDELPPQTRRLLRDLFEWVRTQCEVKQVEQTEYRFTRRQLREALGWSQTALKRHLERLLEMEFVIGHRAGARSSEYELLYDGRGREGQPTLCGLIDPSKLVPITITTVPEEPSSTHPNGGSSHQEPSSPQPEHTDNTGSSISQTSTSPHEMQVESEAARQNATSTNTEAA